MSDDLYETRCSRCRNEECDLLTIEKIQSRCKCEMPHYPIKDDAPCEKFNSRFIEYPLTINGIENRYSEDIKHSLYPCGALACVRPCGEEYKGKTYLGILLGDLPISALISHDRRTGMLSVGAMTNPAIFVPELKKIIYGCESWWSRIDNLDSFKEISNEDIDNTWYVQLLRGMTEPKAEISPD